MTVIARELIVSYGSHQIASVATGTGVYTLSETAPGWMAANGEVHFFGHSNAVNNGTFTIVSVAGTTLTTSNSSSTSESPSAAYAAFPVGGTSSRKLDAISTHDSGFERSSFEMTFVIAKTTEALFAAEVAAVEAVFRMPRHDLIVTQGTNSILSWRHTTNTGFDSEPQIVKREDVAQTGRSRRYVVRILVGMPANNVGAAAGVDGQRDVQVNVYYSPARKRRITFSGTYTGVPTSGTARAKYEAQIAAYCAAALSSLGVSTSELAEEPVTNHNSTNKTISFTRVYDELIYSEAGSASDAQIVRQSFRVARNRIGPGDTPTANRLVELTASYDAWLDKDQTQDLRGKYSSIRTWMVQQAQTTLGGGQVALVSDHPDFDYVENKISSTMTLVGVSQGGVIENRVTHEDFDETGVVLVPVWDAGKPYSRYVYNGPAKKTRIVTMTYRVLGGAGSGSSEPAAAAQVGLNVSLLGVGNGWTGSFQGGGINLPIIGGPVTGAQISSLVDQVMGNQGQNGSSAGGAVQPPGYIPISTKVTKTPLRLGIDSWIIDVVDYEIVRTLEFAVPVGGGTGLPVTA